MLLWMKMIQPVTNSNGLSHLLKQQELTSHIRNKRFLYQGLAHTRHLFIMSRSLQYFRPVISIWPCPCPCPCFVSPTLFSKPLNLDPHTQFSKPTANFSTLRRPASKRSRSRKPIFDRATEALSRSHFVRQMHFMFRSTCWLSHTCTLLSPCLISAIDWAVCLRARDIVYFSDSLGKNLD